MNGDKKESSAVIYSKLNEYTARKALAVLKLLRVPNINRWKQTFRFFFFCIMQTFRLSCIDFSA